MGQKTNPIGLRLGIIRSWDSKWFAQKEYIEFIHEDLWIKNHLKKKLPNGEIARIEIERPSQKKLKVTVSTAKPGVVIGKGGTEIQNLKTFLEKKTNRQVFININEIKEPMLEAQLVAQNIAGQLERRVSYRRAMKRTMEIVLQAGAEGVKVRCSGRLGGSEIARTEEYHKGRVPLHTLRANIDYGWATAYTSYGTVGVKTWIFHGEVLDPKEKARLTSQRMPAPGEVLAEAEPRDGMEAIRKMADTPEAVDAKTDKKPEGVA